MWEQVAKILNKELSVISSIETVSCVTQHQDYTNLTKRVVLEQVGPRLRGMQGKPYRRRAATFVTRGRPTEIGSLTRAFIGRTRADKGCKNFAISDEFFCHSTKGHLLAALTAFLGLESPEDHLECQTPLEFEKVFPGKSLVLRQGTVDDVISRYQHELEQARAINVSLNEQLRTAQAFTLTQWLFSTYKTTRTPKTLQGCKSLNGYLAIIKGHDPPVQPAKTSQQEVQVQESQTLMLQLATTSTETENAVQPLRTDRSERSGVPAESNSEDTPSLTSKEKPPEYNRVDDQSHSVVTAIMSSIANHYSQRTNGLQTIIGLMMVVRTSNDQVVKKEYAFGSLPVGGAGLPTDASTMCTLARGGNKKNFTFNIGLRDQLATACFLQDKEQTVQLRYGPYQNSPYTDEVRECYMGVLRYECLSMANLEEMDHVWDYFATTATQLVTQTHCPCSGIKQGNGHRVSRESFAKNEPQTVLSGKRYEVTRTWGLTTLAWAVWMIASSSCLEEMGAWSRGLQELGTSSVKQRGRGVWSMGLQELGSTSWRLHDLGSSSAKQRGRGVWSRGLQELGANSWRLHYLRTSSVKQRGMGRQTTRQGGLEQGSSGAGGYQLETTRPGEFQRQTTRHEPGPGAGVFRSWELTALVSRYADALTLHAVTLRCLQSSSYDGFQNPSWTPVHAGMPGTSRASGPASGSPSDCRKDVFTALNGEWEGKAHNTNVREYKDDTRKIVKFISAPGQLVHCPFNPAHVVKCCKVEDHFRKCSKCPTERRNSGQSRDQNQARTELVPCLRSRLLGFCLHEEGVAGMQKPMWEHLREAPACRWSFTLNNYGDDDLARLRNIDPAAIKFMVVGAEVSPTTGTPHLQGYVNFSRKVRTPQVKGHLGDRCHVEKAVGNDHDNERYC
ncbi:hypothetical protein Bbelb_051150 [Branchiostoma belcheri]|nr:hypothetical protein Bbelb_051150 [Branchiostoma belcheri]